MMKKIKEISDRRNRIEPQLRLVVRTILQAQLGPQEAKKKCVEHYGIA